MRTTNIFGAAVLALTTSAWSFGAIAQAPAPDTAAPPAADASAPAADASAAPKKHGTKHHHAVHKAAYKGKLAPTAAGDKAVDDLNAASLDAAKENKPFTPPATPPAATKAAYKTEKPMHHKMHKAYKKAEKKADDAAAPAAPADTSK